MTKNMWAGRFSKEVHEEMKKLSYSIAVDQTLILEDIQGSLAHAEALASSKVLTASELTKVQKALIQLQKMAEDGTLEFKDSDEDVHMGVERILTEKIGDLGKKIHTGRSRNDQVATDFKMYIRKACVSLVSDIQELQAAIIQKAEEYFGHWMPGYTHLQQAQPVAISHYLLSFFWALERDKVRFFNCYENHDTCPLGSGAIAGSAFPYNRQWVSEKLGFSAPTENSIDATSHRDFALEFLANVSITGTLLSRYAEDFVIFSSAEFKTILLDDAFTTGSSMMPQKRNPDSMELIRGKTGRLLGNYTSVYTAVKGAPLAYSRDLQEDKAPVFDSYATLENCLRVFKAVMETLQFNLPRIEASADPAMLATDLADDLVKLGIPFREAHFKVGGLVKEAESLKCSLFEVPSSVWDKWIGPKINPKNFDFPSSLARRSLFGGTALKQLRTQIKLAKKKLG